MTPLHELLLRVADDLDGCDISWALVGGLAVGVRTEPRFTRDVDLAVSVEDDRGAEAVVRTLLGRDYKVFALLEQTAVSRLATVRLLPPQGERVVDLLFASSGIEPEIVGQANLLEFGPGVRARVATVGHLVAMKILARDDRRRPQDRVDLVALLAVALPLDLVACEEALVQVVERGYHRDRDLIVELAATLDELGPATSQQADLRG